MAHFNTKSCNTDCCLNCQGGFNPGPCFLNWSSGGADLLQSRILDSADNVIAIAKSGTLGNAETDTYTLQSQCGNSLWVVMDVITWTKRNALDNPECCIDDTGPFCAQVLPVDLSSTPDIVWLNATPPNAWLNGTYALTESIPIFAVTAGYPTVGVVFRYQYYKSGVPNPLAQFCLSSIPGWFETTRTVGSRLIMEFVGFEVEICMLFEEEDAGLNFLYLNPAVKCPIQMRIALISASLDPVSGGGTPCPAGTNYWLRLGPNRRFLRPTVPALSSLIDPFSSIPCGPPPWRLDYSQLSINR